MTGQESYGYEVRFSRGKEVRYISHLDLMRMWERLLRRARLPVAHSQGFNPRPSLTFAAPLPVGVLSRADLLEVKLTEEWDADALLAALQEQAVPGLTIESVQPVVGRQRSLPARMLAADYEIVLHGAEAGSLAEAVETALAATSLPLRVERGKRVREVDLRPLLLDLSVPDPRVALLAARLRHSPEATGRPDDLVAALGFDSARAEITRTGLLLGPA
ncbi:MAG: DUF2344 domain-containing protein [Anaerolineae bacterium]|nr:DUF2344 domain-containing protein [Anaerolineae bacterium]